MIRFLGLTASTVQTLHELVKRPLAPLPVGESPFGYLQNPYERAAIRPSRSDRRPFASAAGHDVEFACQHTIQAACAPVAHGVSNER